MSSIIIGKNEFMDIADRIKAMKINTFYVTGNMILGTDEEFRTLKVIRTEKQFPIKILAKDIALKNFIKNFGVSQELMLDTDTGVILEYPYNGNNIFECNLASPNFHQNVDMMENLYRTAMYYKFNSEPKLFIEDLKSIDEFMQISSMKSADGATLFRVCNHADTTRNYMVSLFNNLLPINKSDKVNLSVYDVDDYKFMSLFRISKKKFEIEVYISSIYL